MDHPSGVFINTNFCLHGFSPEDKLALLQLILSQGGTVENYNPERSTHLVCSVDQGIKEAPIIHNNLPVVNEIFLYQSIYDDQLAPTEQFPPLALPRPFEPNQIYNLKTESVIKTVKKFSTPLAEVLALSIRQTQIPHKAMQLEPPPHPIDKLLEELYPLDKTFSPVQLQVLDEPSVLSQILHLLDGPKVSWLTKLELLEVLAMLLRLNFDKIDALLIQEGLLSSVFNLFFSNPLANVLHSIITSMIVEIFQNHHIRLQRFLINQQALVPILIHKFENDYMRPHLGQIANIFIHISTIQKGLGTKFLESEAGKLFITGPLAQWNERNNNSGWKLIPRPTRPPPQPATKQKLLEADIDLPLIFQAEPTKSRLSCFFCKEPLQEGNVSCTGCGLQYCSKTCLLKHFKAGHRTECKK